MRKKTKAIALLLVLIFIVSLSACGSSTASNIPTAPSSSTTGATSGEHSRQSELERITVLEYKSVPWMSGTNDIYRTTNNGTVTKKTPKDTIIYGNTEFLRPADPVISNEVTTSYNVYDSILEFDIDTGEIKGLLAKDFYYDDDGNFHISLREGVKFHDGSTLTTKDVVYTLERCSDRTIAPRIAGVFSNIDFEKTYIVDDYNMVVVFKSPIGAFTSYLATGTTGIMSKTFMESVGPDYSFLEGDAGCGAYTLVETITGNSQTFKRFDDYWQGKPEVDTIVCRLYTDQTAMFIDYENGAIDAAFGLNYDAVTRILDASIPDSELMLSMTPRTTSLFMQSIKGPMTDARVREAIALSVDPYGVLIAAYQDETMGKVSTSILPEGVKYKVNLGPNEYNPEKSKSILAELGYNSSNPLHIKIMSTTTPDQLVAIEAAQNYMIAVGIDAELIVLDGSVSSTVQNEMTGDPTYDLISNASPISSGDPDEFLSTFAAYGKEIGTFSDYKGIQDQTISELIRKGTTSINHDERVEIYKQLQELIQDGHYILPMICRRRANVIRTYLGTTMYYNASVPLFRFWTIE